MLAFGGVFFIFNDQNCKINEGIKESEEDK